MSYEYGDHGPQTDADIVEQVWSAQVFDSDGNRVATLSGDQDRSNFAQIIGSLNSEYGWVRWEIA